MRQARRLVFSSLAVLGFLGGAGRASAQVELRAGSVSAGGASGVSTNHRVSGSVSRGPHGVGQSPSYSLQYGFWAQIRPAPTVDVDPAPAPTPRPTELWLGPARPNPSTGATRMHLVMPRPAHVRARVIDVSGRIVGTLADQELAAGEHELAFEAIGLASGLYAVRVESDGRVITRRLVIIR